MICLRLFTFNRQSLNSNAIIIKPMVFPMNNKKKNTYTQNVTEDEIQEILKKFHANNQKKENIKKELFYLFFLYKKMKTIS